MRWIEVVRVRNADRDAGPPEPFLRSLDRIRQEGLIEIRSYRHASLDTDLAVCLAWEAPGMDEQGSPLGLCLAGALSAFGLVDHSLWREHGSKSGKRRENDD